MKHRKIKISRRKRRMRMSELYRAKCEQCEQLNRKCRAQETSIRLLQKVIDDAQEHRNALDIENREMRDYIQSLWFQKIPKNKKGVDR